MKTRFLLAAIPALLIASCGGGGDSGNGTTSAPAAPVAAVKPPAGQDWTQVVSKTAEGGYVMGNPNAPIKLIEYGSRICPVCGAFAESGAKPLEANYVATGKVSYEFRDFMVHGAPDFPAAMLGRCAGPDIYFPLLQQFFDAQPTILPKLEGAGELQAKLAGKSKAEISLAWAEQMDLINFVKQRGITEAKARACLADESQFDALAKMMETASNDKGVGGTPTFFVNGKRVENVNSWDGLEPVLKANGG